MRVVVLFLVSAQAFGVDCGQAITRPGTYALSRNCTGGLLVRADNVSLSLNGKTLTCGQNRFGVYAGGVSGLRVHSGKITGCDIGLHGPDASHVLVDSVDFTGNRYIGVSLGGNGNAIRNSTFNAIAGYPSSGYSVGINNPGPNCTLVRNTFRELYKQGQTGEGVAVILRRGKCTIQHNWIENSNPGLDIGIWIAAQASAVIRENVITNCGRAIMGPSSDLYIADNRLVMRLPVAGSFGISAQGGTSSGNLIWGFENPVNIPSFGDIVQ